MSTKKNIYNTTFKIMDYIKSNSRHIQLFRAIADKVQFKTLVAGKNIQIEDRDDKITINALSSNDITNKSYVKFLLHGITLDEHPFILTVSSFSDISIKIIGFSNQGHSSHCFVSKDTVEYVGVRYIEPEFSVSGNYQDCWLQLEGEGKLFTYTIEIVSKTAIDMASSYTIQYLT